MKLSRSTYKLLYFSIIIFTIVAILSGQVRINSELTVIASFLVNMVIFVIYLLKSINVHSFSFDMMFWLFNLIFFGVAPLLQYVTDIYAWGLDPTKSEILKNNLLILVWSVCYIAGMHWARRAKTTKKKEKVVKKSPVQIGYRVRHVDFLAICVAISAMIVLYRVYTTGFYQMMFRDTNSLSVDNQTFRLLLNHGFNNFILFTAVFCIIDAKNRKKIGAKMVIAVLCLIIGCFPTGLDRNMMASFYGGLVIILFDKSRKGRWYALAVYAGLILIFPAINVFRRVANAEGDIWNVMVESFGSSYLDGHYDAHQMIISVQRYVAEYGLCFGRQILGAFLFFVPRALWPAKPIGTGATVIHALDQFSFSNVSAPLVAESYIALGIVGVMVGAILLARFVYRLDKAYWQSEERTSFIRIIYPFAMFMFFFILRGDLLSGWSFTFAQLFVGSCFGGFFLKKYKKKSVLVSKNEET